MTNGDFEDEELGRLAEEEKGRLCVTVGDGNATGSDNHMRIKRHNDMMRVDRSVTPRDAGVGTLPEPHDFEAARAWTMEFLLDRVKNIFCANCVHRPVTQLTCAQANCDTLERLEGRLWKVEG